ncbi:hypothetical protein EZV73_21245 [Acidaminobacter sp. JC074]|uniref:aspartate/glutamate racemase family protein n=1 Tax=Acidaminobacter sp. JC074 TaxID=2530199 RepID=UPI001F1124C7|nr:aspartate/glutamate racemase family protein [Acidaminobacter sp. JC074]MCH4890120.1 hypothetical protein [Acidaminobacter sp. JC074]
MKIAYIDPVGKEHALESLLDGVKSYARKSTVIDYLTLDSGAVTLENEEDELKAIEGMDRLIDSTDYDAYIIGCFYDPGLKEMREKHSVIMTGPFEATSHIGFMLDDQATIIAGNEDHTRRISIQTFDSVFESSKFKTKSLGMSVEDMLMDPDKTEGKMIHTCKDAGRIIIPGCTIESGRFENMQKLINKKIIDPIVASVKYVEFLYELKMTCKW